MMYNQEKDKRIFFEQSKTSGSDSSYLKKIDQLEAKISEYRRKELEYEQQIKQFEEELEAKDEEIDGLLANIENNELVDRIMTLTNEKEEFEREIGNDH